MWVDAGDPNSIGDLDVMAFCVPPESYYFGLDQYASRGTKEIKHNEWDVVVYEARKAIGLLENGNPNVLSMLWVPEEFILHETAEGAFLRRERGVFRGRHIYKSFTRYAHGQLQRITNGALEGHMGEKRRAIVERFGYVTRDAAHLIRLLRMGVEFLQTGDLVVFRPDAQELVEIKLGGWSLDQVKREANELFSQAESAYQVSRLPDRPDHDAVNRLCVEIVYSALSNRGR